MSWTALCQSYTGADSVYCLPIMKARLLVSDALRLRLTDSINSVLLERVDLIEGQQRAAVDSYTNLLNLSEQKYEKQKEITSDFSRLADSWRSEADYYQKRYKKQRNQKGLLTAGVVVLVGLIILK